VVRKEDYLAGRSKGPASKELMSMVRRVEQDSGDTDRRSDTSGSTSSVTSQHECSW